MAIASLVGGCAGDTENGSSGSPDDGRSDGGPEGAPEEDDLGDPSSGSPDGVDEPGDVEEGAGEAPDAKVVGMLTTYDDVGDPGHEPISDATLLVLPLEEADVLWELTQYPPSEGELSTIGGSFDASEAPSHWGTVTVEDGWFGFEPSDGDHLVCMVGGSYSLRGCAEVSVSGPTMLTGMRGEGGFELWDDEAGPGG